MIPVYKNSGIVHAIASMGAFMDKYPKDAVETGLRKKHFEQSCGLVRAAADLLSAASESTDRTLTTTLDDSTLWHLANMIYRESLIMDTLYTQLQEIYDQSRAGFCMSFDKSPQILIPLDNLNVQQLNEAINEIRRKINILQAHDQVDQNSITLEKISCLNSTLGNLEAELIRREYHS